MPSNRHLTPHDALFKKSLQRSAVAEQFLRRYLPLCLREAVEWGTLTVENVELVDGNLQKMACDVVFSFKLKQQQDGYIYILLEHQRMMDPLLPFRLLKYGVHLISRHLKKNAESKLLPVIFPLVIYNGDASYSCSTCLLDLFPIELRDHVQQFLVGQHQVLDLVHSRNCINPGDIWVAPMLEALRQGSNKNITNQYIGDIVSALDRLADQEDIGYINEILHYLCAVQDASHYEQLWKTLPRSRF